MSKQIKWVLSCVLALAITPAWSLDKVLEITGNGELQVVPDMAQLIVSVETRATEAKEAITQNAQSSKKVIDYLKKTIKDDNAIQTGQFNLNPVYEYDNARKKSNLTGYQVTNQIQLETKDLSKLGNLMDEIVNLGATRIDGLTFKHSNEKQLSDEALKKAILNGKQQAQLIADTAGISLGKIVNIRPVSSGGIQPFAKSFALTAREAVPSTPIETGELTITSQINMIFAIE